MHRGELGRNAAYRVTGIDTLLDNAPPIVIGKRIDELRKFLCIASDSDTDGAASLHDVGEEIQEGYLYECPI